MDDENIKTEPSPCDNEKIELPKDIQKRMLEFFLQTSIPRKKAMINNSLPDKNMAGE